MGRKEAGHGGNNTFHSSGNAAKKNLLHGALSPNTMYNEM